MRSRLWTRESLGSIVPGGRLREKQYQLAAQKQNEAFLRCNYYREIAKYFERECEIARHFDSWNLKDSEPKQRLDKSRKAERLLARRNKLKNLLEKEQAAYDKQIEESKARRRSAQVPSLEVLREKLKEKRAEQNLYLPRTCRRYQSYFVCPTEPTKHLHWSKYWDSSPQSSSRVCRDATNLIHQTEKKSPLSSSRMDRNENDYSHARYKARCSHRSLKDTNVRDNKSDNSDEYLPNAGGAEQVATSYPSFDHSLHENHPPSTGKAAGMGANEERKNVKDKSSDNFEYAPNAGGAEQVTTSYPSFDHSLHENHPPSTGKAAGMGANEERRNVKDKSSDNYEYELNAGGAEQVATSYPSFDRSLHENQSPLAEKAAVVDVMKENYRTDISHAKDLIEQRANTLSEHEDLNSPENPEAVDDLSEELLKVNLRTQEELDETDRSNIKNAADRQDLNAKDNREFESEKSLPWLRIDPSDKNLSKQMFLYLTHKELKHKIEDLEKRELHACMKHNWDDALRLRDMKNRLELLREQRLYSTDDLNLDEDTRKLGLANIKKRSEELAGREDACTDSSMYSEDAKDLWNKWVKEDEGSVIKDARLLRETLMNSLEKEWQNLAIRDKDKISRSYENVYDGSALQEEQNLTAAIAARMRSLSGPAK